MASGTSLALPRPTPTCPLPSPTTTSAEKLNRRPPLTTLATRLMWTTRSCRSSSELGSIAVMFALERETGFARRVCEGLHAPVVEEPVAVEDDLLDALRLARGGDGLADGLRGVGLLRVADAGLDVLAERRDAEQRLRR